MLIRRVVDRAVHRDGGEQAGRDERGVADRVAVRPGDVADQRADADADGQQVEQRLEEAGDEHQPDPPVDQEVALDQPPGAARRPAGAAWSGRRASAVAVSRPSQTASRRR